MVFIYFLQPIFIGFIRHIHVLGNFFPFLRGKGIGVRSAGTGAAELIDTRCDAATQMFFEPTLVSTRLAISEPFELGGNS